MLCANYDAKTVAANGAAGFYASEKYDGWRMFYRDGAFYSRTGKPLSPPQHIADAAEALLAADEAAGGRALVLDGELWLGYERFQDTHAALDAKSPELQWLLFDMPSATGGYCERATALGALAADAAADCRVTPDGRVAAAADCRVRVIAQTRCADRASLDAYYTTLLAAEPRAEGIVVRAADLPYHWNARHAAFMKRKPFRDLEATVVGYHTIAPRTPESAAARPDGYVSSLICRVASGSDFKLTYKGARPPPIGALVTVKYQNLTENGLPRFPSLKGIRSAVDAPAAEKPPTPAPAAKTVLPKGATVASLPELAQAAKIAAQSGVTLEFAPGSAIYVAASSAGEYYCVRRPRQPEALPYCTCASWKFQRIAPPARVCKHTAAIMAALGRTVKPTPMIRFARRA
jgi:DNA ligase-1